MLNSQLYYTFRKLDNKERQAVAEYSQSPFFNKKDEVAKLCSYFAKNIGKQEGKLFLKTQVYKSIFPKQEYDDTKLRLTMSACLKLVERYLAIQQMESDPNDRDMYLLQALRQRGMDKRFEKKLKTVRSGLDMANRRDANWNRLNYYLASEHLEGESGKRRSSRLELHPLNDHLTTYYLSEMLRHACSALTHQAISAQVYDMGLLAQVLRLADAFGVEQRPAIAIYYYASKALQNPDDPQYFDQWRNCLNASEGLFSNVELRSIYLLGINFCIRQMNRGGQRFIKEAFDLYRAALEKDLLAENGYLTAFTFKNIIRIGTALNEHDWINGFFEKYQSSLHPSERSNVVRYNAAFLHFRRKEYDKAMPLLQQSDFADTLNNLDARRMLLRIYFELEEWQALDSLMHSFTTYLRRQKDLGYHKDLYLNLLRYLRQMLELPKGDKKGLEKLKLRVKETPLVAEREWLLEQIAENL